MPATRLGGASGGGASGGGAGRSSSSRFGSLKIGTMSSSSSSTISSGPTILSSFDASCLFNGGLGGFSIMEASGAWSLFLMLSFTRITNFLMGGRLAIFLSL